MSGRTRLSLGSWLVGVSAGIGFVLLLSPGVPWWAGASSMAASIVSEFLVITRGEP